ncbi:BppU family phage baseplate upper protein [Staphylococcus xylosus]
MALNKIATTQLDTTAYYQKLLDLNVRFFVNDDNTAILDFPVTRNDKPVPLSEVNTKSYIAIITPDGSKKIDYLEFYDELNGVLRYKLPNDVLAHVGKHHAQVYISVKGVSDVVVERKISFHVEDDYINSIDADTKLSYIRIFDDLYSAIQERVVAIEKAIENAADYVTQIENARDKAYEDITNLVNQTKQEIETIIDDYKTEILNTLNDSEKTIEERSEHYIQQAENAKTEVTQAINSAELVKESWVREMISDMETKTNASQKIDTAIDNLRKYIDDGDWQKSKLTTDLGSAIKIENLDFDSFNASINNTGLYYIVNGVSGPKDISEGLLKYTKNLTQTDYEETETSDGLIEIYPFNNSKEKYIAWINNGVIKEWKKSNALNIEDDSLSEEEINTLISNTKKELEKSIDNTFTDTGWIDLTLINGAVTYGSNTIPKIRMFSMNGMKIIGLKGAVKGVEGKGSIGMAPKAIADAIGETRSFVQNTSIDNGTNFNRFSLTSNGEVRLDSSTLTTIKDTHWFPIDITIMI